MKKKMVSPELSVIVPVLNEASTLPELFRTLADQVGASIELVVSDGGSTDGTADLARQLGNEALFPVAVIAGECGRGRQLNSGAAASRCATLLFLHADSHFADPLALRTALDLLAKEITLKKHDRIAGHFPLRFVRRDSSPSIAFYFYECKARLPRRECTHGDQGFMMRRTFFTKMGPIDESLPMLAETRFAESVRESGEWLLFPVEILTSARRFESEGLYSRQVLNAIIMNFAALGWETFFRELPSIYACQDQNGRIALSPILQAISRLIAALPLRERLFLWYASGNYVRSHAWQIPFFLDTLRNFQRGNPVGEGNSPFLAFHDHYLYRLIDHLPGRLAAASLTWLWFQLTSLHASIKEKTLMKEQPFESS
jgi:rSAM/selenodomain-associated transferase 2